MKSRILIDFVCIIVLYAIYWVVVYSTVFFDVGAQLEVFPPVMPDGQIMTWPDFYNLFQYLAQLVIGASLMVTLAWYVVGQWGFKPHSTTSSTWLLVWLVGLVLVIGAGITAFWLGPIPSQNPARLAGFYLVSGAIFYYLATVLFSPVNVKYIVPGAKTFRRW